MMTMPLRFITERRRLIPEALVMEAKLVAIIIRGRDHIGYHEKGRDTPARLVCFITYRSFPHQFIETESSGNRTTSREALPGICLESA
jgi:hypothetical protein